MKGFCFIRFATFLIVCSVLFGCAPEEEKLGTIYGTVTDFSSGDPVANANVRLNPRGETTLTGMDGTFQFNDLPAGSYSLSLSKNGYVDLDDDYVVKIEKGNTVQRSVQMQKLHYSLRIVDNEGNTVSLIDFGVEEGVNQKTFSIFNTGNILLDFAITKTSNWIEEVTPSVGTINIGDSKAVSLKINRKLLSEGQNSTSLLITTSNLGGVELMVKAIKPILPTVKTNDVSNVGQHGATCGGNVTTDGGLTVNERGICYSKTEQPTIENFHVSGGSGTGEFSCSMTDLDENTTFFVRAYATNNVGTSYGMQKSFQTKGRPTVATGNVTNITSHNAICTGNVTDDGGSSVTIRGICWSIAPNPTINSNTASNGSGLGSFSCEMTDLTNNTVYYVRAYAKNSTGISYGEEITFETALLPTFQFGGYTYQVAPCSNVKVQWSIANTYCNGLTIYGLSNWRLPTKDELLQMYADKEKIGDFLAEYYWSSTLEGYSIVGERPQYYAISFSNGFVNYFEDSDYGNNKCYVRPIRRLD